MEVWLIILLCQEDHCQCCKYSCHISQRLSSSKLKFQALRLLQLNKDNCILNQASILSEYNSSNVMKKQLYSMHPRCICIQPYMRSYIKKTCPFLPTLTIVFLPIDKYYISWYIRPDMKQIQHGYSKYIYAIWYMLIHYYDVIMGAIASQITSLAIVYSTFYSDADQSKHQSSASLAFVREIHRGPVNFPHKRPVTRKFFCIWWRHHVY